MLAYYRFFLGVQGAWGLKNCIGDKQFSGVMHFTCKTQLFYVQTMQPGQFGNFARNLTNTVPMPILNGPGLFD